MNDTEEQAAIIAAAASGKGSIAVQALAGTGKSTTLKRSLVRIPQKSVLICAFNKRVADEMQATLPPKPAGSVWKVQTFHSLGLSVLKTYYPRLQVDKKATEDLVNRAAGQAISFKMRRAAVQLLRMLKETWAEPLTPSAAHVLALGLEYDYFQKLSEVEMGLAVEATRDAYVLSLDFANRESIDYCDMVWGPVVLGLAPKSRYQVVMVDELQDISKPQLILLRMVLIPNGRFFGVGDLKQQIYGWRGSMGAAAWSIVTDELKAKVYPLTMTWRCSVAVVEAARALVPQLRARPDAPKGAVQDCTWANLPRAILGTTNIMASGPLTFGANKLTDDKIHTFVLSRNNSNLLDCALYLWRERVRFELNAGKELLDPLFNVLDTKLDCRSVESFHKTLKVWEDGELLRAEKANATAYAERIEEQATMLRVAVAYTTPSGIKRLLSDIMNPNDSGVLLSTVHKVKGLEAERVFLLKQTFARHDARTCKFCGGDGCGSCHNTGKWTKPAEPEELNIEYVGITRAITRLIWVDIRARDDKDRRRLNESIFKAGEQAGVSSDDQLAHALRGTLEQMTGTKIKTEKGQIVAAASTLIGGYSRVQAQAIADGAGKHHDIDGDIGDDYSEEP